MTSTPRKLELEPLTKEGLVAITSFEGLGAALSGDRFRDCTAEFPEDGVISLTQEGIILFLVDRHIWRETERVKPYFESSNAQNITLICCGNEDDFAKLPEHLNEAYVHLLVLPSNLSTIDFQVRGLFKTKDYYNEASRSLANADETLSNVKHVLSISRELNGIRDFNKLLTLILAKAREVTQADAGSIYVVEPPTENEAGAIVFKISQNSSVKQDLSEFRIPINDQSIVGNSALHEATINIPDLYALDPDPSKNPFNAKHDTSWDKRIGYECHSMLSLPMFDISHSVIGVIQLINRKTGKDPLKTAEDFSTRVRPFDETAVEYAEIVAHQAGIALENALLTEEKQALFEGFVNASVKAIEQRDPTTSGHSHRVAQLTLKLAELTDRTDTGPYKDVSFNEKQLKEIEYASLLHDFGKLGVREQVLLKAKKLYPDELKLLLERFELIRTQYHVEYLQEVINFHQAPQTFPPGLGPEQFKTEYEARLAKLEDYLGFILKANEPTVLEQGGFERLKDIANLSFSDSRTPSRPYLLDDELKALSVSRGSLTSDEFSEIQSHVTHTYEFLRKIPWGKELANVPQIAAKHHEKLDGTGYPTSCISEEIPVQSRMMTIADIFDALTASDRPYKKAVPVDRALDIIEMEVKAGKCDSDLFKIFIESKSYELVL